MSYKTIDLRRPVNQSKIRAYCVRISNAIRFHKNGPRPGQSPIPQSINMAHGLPRERSSLLADICVANACDGANQFHTNPARRLALVVAHTEPSDRNVAVVFRWQCGGMCPLQYDRSQIGAAHLLNYRVNHRHILHIHIAILPMVIHHLPAHCRFCESKLCASFGIWCDLCYG